MDTGNYRIATPAIQAFYDLVTRCLHYRIMGALIYGPSRIGKTRAIEYVRLLLARNYPKITSYHAQCEHKPRHAEGPLFSNLLEAVGHPEPNAGGNPAKRMRLSAKIREAAARAGSGTGLLFCDEAQRYNENEYEWLRDVHDALDRQQIKLFTFLVGQQELLAQKTSLQIAGKTQIVARDQWSRNCRSTASAMPRTQRRVCMDMIRPLTHHLAPSRPPRPTRFSATALLPYTAKPLPSHRGSRHHQMGSADACVGCHARTLLRSGRPARRSAGTARHGALAKSITTSAQVLYMGIIRCKKLLQVCNP